MKIPQTKIDEIASSIDIVDVISAYTPLRKAGRSFMGRCPFHEEKTPSFSVSQEKGVYHCFGCGKSGNMFTFVMDTENVNFFEAVKMLAEKAGIPIEFENEPFDPDRNKIELYYEINAKAGRYFHDNLLARGGAYAKEYLAGRGLKDDTLTKFGIGYSLREKDALYRTFGGDYSLEDLTETGLVLNIGANEVRDRFRGRLMFPIFNESGKVVGFGGRRMYDESTEEAKYINSPETKIYNKSKTLYGLNFAKGAIKQQGYVILVEGYMDLISLYQNGIENVVASSGTSLTQLHAKIISRYTKEVVVVFDSDLAGQNASRRAIELLIENDISVSVLALPPGDDPDTFIKKNGLDGFNRFLNRRLKIIDYIAESYEVRGGLSTPEGKTEFVREIIGLITKMRDPIKRDFYIKDVAERFGIYESIIRKELESFKGLKSRGLTRETNLEKTLEVKKEQIAKLTAIELVLVRLLIDSDPTTKNMLLDELEIDFIPSPTVKKIVNYIIRNINNPHLISINSLFNEFQDHDSNEILGKALIDDIYFQETKNKDFKDAANIVLKQLKIFSLNNMMERLKLKIKEGNQNPNDIMIIQDNIVKLKTELQQLKKSLQN